MTAGELLTNFSAITYYGGWASLLFIPYWMCLFFSNEKKKELEKSFE